MNTPSEYFTLYPCAGRTRTYTFSIDALTPVRAMTKRELADLYFSSPSVEGNHAHRALAHADGFVYLSDVLRDIAPCDTAKRFLPAHVAAVFHFLGPVPDAQDGAESTPETPHDAIIPQAA